MSITLVTGALGFSAGVLCKNLNRISVDLIFLTDIKSDSAKKFFACDLAAAAETEKLIAEIKPDKIFHLAATYSGNLEKNISVNALAAANLLEGVLKHNKKCRILLIGSAAEYGQVRPEENPVSETHPLRPSSAYGISKVLQTHIMDWYHRQYRLDVLMARTFNLIGEGVSENLFAGNLYAQIKKLKEGAIQKIVLGNLEHRRDYLPVEMAVEHYSVIMEKGKPGEVYNVGSGVSIKMRDLLNKILTENNLTMQDLEQKSVSGALPDVPDIYADISKLKSLGTADEKKD